MTARQIVDSFPACRQWSGQTKAMLTEQIEEAISAAVEADRERYADMLRERIAYASFRKSRVAVSILAEVEKEIRDREATKKGSAK